MADAPTRRSKEATSAWEGTFTHPSFGKRAVNVRIVLHSATKGRWTVPACSAARGGVLGAGSDAGTCLAQDEKGPLAAAVDCLFLWCATGRAPRVRRNLLPRQVWGKAIQEQTEHVFLEQQGEAWTFHDDDRPPPGERGEMARAARTARAPPHYFSAALRT